MSLRLLTRAEDVGEHELRLVADCVGDWFPEGPISEDCFIDRLCESYLNGDGGDIESLDTPAVRKIMRHARHTQREIA